MQLSTTSRSFETPPSYPSARLTQAALADAVPAGQFADKKLQKVAEESQLSADMVEWWKTQKCDTIEKVAVACTEEKERCRGHRLADRPLVRR